MGADPALVAPERDGLYGKTQSGVPNIPVTVNVTANYTLDADDLENLLLVNAAAEVTITLPATFPVGFSVSAVQLGAGDALFAAAAGGTLASVTNYVKTAGQYAKVQATVVSNADGKSAVWILTGEGAVAV